MDICVNWQHHWQQISQLGGKAISPLDRPPVLVVAVTSTSENEDYQKKYQEYVSVGIPEYWIVNRRKEHLRVCTSTYSGGPYQCGEFGKGERIVSQVLAQLELTVDEVLNHTAVRQLVELEQRPTDSGARGAGG